jgi:hypothetical protein
MTTDVVTVNERAPFKEMTLLLSARRVSMAAGPRP